MNNDVGDPYQDYDNLLKKFNETQKDRDELSRELQRLKDLKDIMKMKDSSIKGAEIEQ